MYFEPFHWGADFNVNNMAGVKLLHKDGIYYAVKELVGLRDTPDLIEAILEDAQDHKVIVYPDASGKNRKSTDASISDISLLRKAGFTVRAKSYNPPVKDRIAAVNRALESGKLKINTSICINLTEALEQQVYTPNGQPDKESGLDHILDALGYPIHYIMPVFENGIRSTGVMH